MSRIALNYVAVVVIVLLVLTLAAIVQDWWDARRGR